MQPDLNSAAGFEQAYREHASRVFHTAMRILRDPVAAEDLTQDVFLGLWRNPGAYKPGRGPLSMYLTILARSRALDRFRADGSARAALERAGAAASADPPADAAGESERADERRRLLDALGAVPVPQRQALVAHAVGLSCRELADSLGIPVPTAKSRLRAGAARARQALAEAA